MPDEPFNEQVDEPEQLPKITASEIAEYAFCPMSWYLRRFERVEPEPHKIEAGQRYHAAVGETVRKATELEERSRTFLWLAFLLMIFAAILWMWIWLRV